MENRSEKINLEKILKSAFFYWKKTLLYQFIYSLMFFSLFFLGYFYLFKYFGLSEEFSKFKDLVQTDLPAFNKKMEDLAKLPQARNFSLAFFVLLALINPLNVGLYKIFRKTDLNEPVSLNDLFAGYLGIDFFKFFGFYLFWIIIFTYANALLVLGIVWIFITLFSIPLLFFQNITTFNGIGLTVKILGKHFGVIIISSIVALLFGASGIFLFGIGFLFTYPFWNAMIYVLYQAFFKEESKDLI